ncbi:MAG: hypothetical protein ABS86_02790 [Sphingobium sp. SCN 64-10]|nr:MAG: hypothetical protein ABS86_02790 [Sphingobium sp. SCN 64-10]
MAIMLQEKLGIPFDTTYRLACAATCLAFIAQFGLDAPQERWPWIGFVIALLVNAGLFFTPLFDRPASRGEIMLFALPDAVVMLGARIAYYPVADDHQRAVRQQLIVGLILAMAFCAIVLASAFAG